MVDKSDEIHCLFNKENFGVVLAANEIFLRCHEQGGRGGEVLVLKGTKRVHPTKDRNVKEGCMLMLTMGMASSQLLMSKIFFKGMYLQFNDI